MNGLVLFVVASASMFAGYCLAALMQSASLFDDDLDAEEIRRRMDKWDGNR